MNCFFSNLIEQAELLTTTNDSLLNLRNHMDVIFSRYEDELNSLKNRLDAFEHRMKIHDKAVSTAGYAAGGTCAILTIATAVEGTAAVGTVAAIAATAAPIILIAGAAAGIGYGVHRWIMS